MRRLLFAVLAFAPGALSAACSASNGGASDAATDYFGVLPGPDAAGGTDGDGGGSALSTTMRLAHLSPDVGPLDFCWRPSGSATFTGPVLRPALDAGAQDAAFDATHDATLDATHDATLDAPVDAMLDATHEADTSDAGADASADGATAGDAASEAGLVDAEAGDASAGDGGTRALEFGDLTPDVALNAAGTFDIALVTAGALSCGQPLLVRQVTLDAGKRSTVAVMGLAASDAGAASALSVVAFTDDRSSDAQNARVRWIHAALGWPGAALPAPPLSVTANGPPLTPLATEMDPKHVSAMSASDPTVDGLGYSTVRPLSKTQLTFQSVGDGGLSRWQTADQLDWGLTAGTVHTGFVVSAGAGALGVLWCGEAKTAGSFPPCGFFPAH